MLCLSLFWAFTVYLVYRPWHGWPEIMGTVSFIIGMPVGEYALHIIGIEALITLLVVWNGGLAGGEDALGLAIGFASWAALLWHYVSSHKAGPVMDAAIRQALGDDYEDDIDPERAALIDDEVDYKALLKPFNFKDSEVRKLTNIEYGNENGVRLLLDVYHHVDKPENAPVLFQIHGGAWLQNLGDKSQQALPLMYQLARHGWVCITVDYRLSPAATMPEHIVDCKRALAWTKENVHKYGGDPDFIVATGGSAGGHLSALLAFTANDPELQPGFEEADTSVQGVVPVYGVHDFTNSRNQRPFSGLADLVADKVIKLPMQDNLEIWQSLSPLFRVHKDVPPTLLVHGDADSLAPPSESRALWDEFSEYPDVQAGYAEIPGAQHAFELGKTLRTHYFVNGVERFACALHGRYLAAKG